MTVLIALVAILLSASLASAQQRPPDDLPGGPHELLRQFVGEWEAHGRMWRSADSSVPPLEGTVTFSTEMVMDGRFLVEKMTSVPPGPPFESVRIVAYDNLTRRYEGAAYDSRGTNIIRQAGELTPAGALVLTYTYTDVGTGATVTRRTVRRVVSDSEWIETAFESHSGTERKVTEIRARRKG